jgi:hypothetical protein
MISVTFEREGYANWPFLLLFLLQVEIAGDGSTKTNMKIYTINSYGFKLTFDTLYQDSFESFDLIEKKRKKKEKKE